MTALNAMTKAQLADEVKRLRRRIGALEKQGTSGQGPSPAEDFAQLKYLTGHMPFYLAWKDRDGKYLGCNENQARAIGLDDPAEIVGKTDFDLPWSRAEAELYRKGDRQVVRTGKPLIDREATQRRADGTVMNIVTSKVPLRDRRGRTSGVISIFADITDRKRMEEALRESEERFRRLVERMNDGLVSLDADGVVTYVNPRACEIVDREPSDVLGRPMSDFVPEDQRVMLRTQFEARKKGSRQPYEMAYDHEDGRTVYAIVSPEPEYDEAGRFIGASAVLTEITDRKERERELAEKTALLETTLENMTEGITVTDTDLNVIMLNRAGMKLAGFSRKLFKPGDNIEKYFRYNAERGEYGPGDPEQQVRERMKLARRFEPHEFQRTRPNGTVIEIRGTPLPGGGMVTTYTDVTERRRAEAALRKSEAEAVEARTYLEDALESIGEGFALYDADERLVMCNSHYRRMWSSIGDHIVPGAEFGDLCKLSWDNGLVRGVDLSREEWLELRLASFRKDEHVMERQLAEDRWALITERRTRDGGVVLVATDISERKLAEQALRDSEARLKAFMDNAPVVMLLKDTRCRYISVNTGYEKAYGIREAQVLGKRLRDVVPAKYASPTEAMDREVLRTGRGASLEDILVQDGKLHTYFTIKFPIRDGAGAIVNVGTVSIDITEQKQAEEALRESEARLKAIMDNAPVDMSLKDLDGRYLLANTEFERSTGTEAAKVIGSTARDIFPEQIADRIAAADDAVRESGKTLDDELELELPGGLRTMHTIKFPIRDAAGKIVSIGSIAADITERKEAERRLHESEERFRLISETAPVPIFITDIESGETMFCNEGAGRLLGASREALIGGQIRDRYADPEERKALVAELRERGQFDSRPLEIVRPDGARRSVSISGRMIDHGGRAGFLSVLVDMTDRLRAEEALRRVRDELEDRVAERTAALAAAQKQTAAAHARLSEAVGAMAEGFALFDADDRLVMWNGKYNKFFPILEDIIRPDVKFETLIRTAVERGQYGISDEARETWLRRRSAAHERADGVFEQRLADGRWLWVTEHKTPDGHTIATYTDVSELKQKESALRENERRFRDFAAAASDWLWETDADLRFTYMSPNVEDMTGIPPEMHYGKTREELLGGDYDREAWDEHLRTLRDHKPFRDFTYFRSLEGYRPVWIRTGGVPVFADDGAFQGYRGAASDVTELREHEEAVRRSEQRLTDAIESIGEGFVLFDSEDRLVLFNERYREMYAGIADLIRPGAGFADLVRAGAERGRVPASAGALDAWVEERIDRHRNPGGPFEEYHAEGRWVLVEERRTGEGGVVGTRTDITERKRTEERFQKFFQLPLIGSAIYAPDKSWIEVNDALCELLGYSREDLMNLTWADVTHPDDLADNIRIFDESVTGKRDTYWMDKRFIRSDGEFVHARISVQCLRKADGSPDYFILLVQDTSEQRAAEEQLRQAQKTEAIGQLTGGIAHDFNNLLSIILGNVELVEERVRDDQRSKALVDSAIQASLRGAELTQRLLAFARQQPLRPLAVDSNRLVSGIATLLRRTFAETIEIQTRLADDAWPALADAGQLEAAIVNLSINSRDAMPEGGRLTIATGNVTVDTEHQAGSLDLAPGDYVTVAVGDTGTGISDAILVRVFDPFFTTKEVGMGSGLGLSMVYGFVKQSGGHVEIDTAPDRGTEVTLYLPRAAGDIAGQAEAAQGPATDSERGHAEH